MYKANNPESESGNCVQTLSTKAETSLLASTAWLDSGPCWSAMPWRPDTVKLNKSGVPDT